MKKINIMESPVAGEDDDTSQAGKTRDISAAFENVSLEGEDAATRLKRRTDSDPSPGLPIKSEEEFK